MASTLLLNYIRFKNYEFFIFGKVYMHNEYNAKIITTRI